MGAREIGCSSIWRFWAKVKLRFGASPGAGHSEGAEQARHRER